MTLRSAEWPHLQVPRYNHQVDRWNSTFAAAFANLSITVGILVTPNPIRTGARAY